MEGEENATMIRTGIPFPPELRARVMKLHDDGIPILEISARLLVSRQTIYRYLDAAEEQDALIPKPKPAGGYRVSKVNRDIIVNLAKLSMEKPKLTLDELSTLATERKIWSKPVSISTIWRVLQKAGITHKRAGIHDPGTETDPLIAFERRLFRELQYSDPDLDVRFVDETNFRLNEQQKYAWGPGRVVLDKQKGQTQTYAVMATIGMDGILHYVIRKPERALEALGARYEAGKRCECRIFQG